MNDRTYSLTDKFIIALDTGFRVLFHKAEAARITPAQPIAEDSLTETQKTKSSRLMRIDHAGEVCAQALYLGQAFVAQCAKTKTQLMAAAEEENDHLAWCEHRLCELGGRLSYLNPLWYLGSFLTGMIAGVMGDRWSFGFIIETERQVVAHLEEHLSCLPENDFKSRAILAQMKEDEACHATEAFKAGGKSLPVEIQFLMRQTAKIMTRIAYWV